MPTTFTSNLSPSTSSSTSTSTSTCAFLPPTTTSTTSILDTSNVRTSTAELQPVIEDGFIQNPAIIHKIVFLGTGSAVPAPRYRNTSAIALQLSSGSIILIDCGEATQHQIMQSKSISAIRIDLILITHLHGDHCWGLFGTLCTLATNGRTTPITLIGPRGLRHMIETVFQTSGGFNSFELRFHEIDGFQSHDLGLFTNGIHIQAYPLSHRIPAYAYTIHEATRPGALNGALARSLGVPPGPALGQLKMGHDITLPDGTVVKSSDVTGEPIKGVKLCVMQDTYESSAAIPGVADVDIMIHEATYDASLYDKAVAHGHSTTTMAGTYTATHTHAHTLILTHFSTRYMKRVDGERQLALKAARIAQAQMNVEKKQKIQKNQEKEEHVESKKEQKVEPSIYIEDMIVETENAIAAVHASRTDDVHPVRVIAAEDFMLLKLKQGQIYQIDSDKKSTYEEDDRINIDTDT